MCCVHSWRERICWHVGLLVSCVILGRGRVFSLLPCWLVGWLVEDYACSGAHPGLHSARGGREGINKELPERSLGCFLPVFVTYRKQWRFSLVILFCATVCILNNLAETSNLLVYRKNSSYPLSPSGL